VGLIVSIEGRVSPVNEGSSGTLLKILRPNAISDFMSIWACDERGQDLGERSKKKRRKK